MISLDNYDEWMLLRADGELDTASEAALSKFIALHPELEKEWKMYQAIRFRPDESIRFEGKESLLKPEGKTRIITFGKGVKYAVAAGLLLMMMLGGKWVLENRRAGNEIVINKPAESKPLASKVEEKQVEPETLIPSNKIEKTIASQTKKATTAALEKRKLNHSNTSIIAQQKTETIAQQKPAKLLHEKIKSISSILLPTRVSGVEAATVAMADERRIMVRTEMAAEENNFLDGLPISDGKKEGIQTIFNNIDQTIAKAKTLRNDLKDAEVVVRIGNKDFHLFNF